MINFYHLLEPANVHGGDLSSLLALLDEFAPFTERTGIKFQILHPDHIALPDYQWYSVYQELYFEPEEWGRIFQHAIKTKDIWLDQFDAYSVDILEQYHDLITGMKLQASILDNQQVFSRLSELDLSSKSLILNISALDLDTIHQVVNKFHSALSPENLYLQIGFQDYPSSFVDSGLAKIQTLQRHFQYPISFADHLAPDDPEVIHLPLVAGLTGAMLIEKHVRRSGPNPKYDHFSALDPEHYRKYRETFERYQDAYLQPFINEKEQNYLVKTLQIPVASSHLAAGKLLSPQNDLDFRRSNQTGMDTPSLHRLLESHHILATDKHQGTAFHTHDFRKANVAAIIACRLKSSRLPRKAVLKIGNLSSIELCIRNTLKFSNVSHTILATSTLEEDQELKAHTYRPDVIYHTGDPEDVIRRYLDIIDKLHIDVFVRITGDMPYVSDEIFQYLLEAHFQSGADYTAGNEAALGTNLEIINSQALRKVSDHFPSADYSEYMTWYFKNNPEHFHLNFVDLPDHLIRDYRLTLDYPEDLELFRRIEDHFADEDLDFTLPRLFDFLDKNPDLAAINKDGIVKYHTDSKLIETLNRVTKIQPDI